jgi:hypothetical protein
MFAWMLLLSLTALAAPTIHIDRAGRTLYLIEDGVVIQTAPVGIGRGGLGEKTGMADLITPVGDFTVDLVLSEGFSAVDPAVLPRFSADAELAAMLADLPALWANMGRIDFDGDGAADGAYGPAYIGLSAPDGVTGPKLRRYRDGTIYWFSIALHGTPDPANIGAARSGGCVHLADALLAQLIASGAADIGSPVVIRDGPPATPGPAR